MGSAEICGICRFWDQVEQSGQGSPIGECRRHPPVIVGPIATGLMASDHTHFPETEAWRWCGEWTPAQRPKERA